MVTGSDTLTSRALYVGSEFKNKLFSVVREERNIRIIYPSAKWQIISAEHLYPLLTCDLRLFQ